MLILYTKNGVLSSSAVQHGRCTGEQLRLRIRARKQHAVNGIRRKAEEECTLCRIGKLLVCGRTGQHGKRICFSRTAQKRCGAVARGEQDGKCGCGAEHIGCHTEEAVQGGAADGGIGVFFGRGKGIELLRAVCPLCRIAEPSGKASLKSGTERKCGRTGGTEGMEQQWTGNAVGIGTQMARCPVAAQNVSGRRRKQRHCRIEVTALYTCADGRCGNDGILYTGICPGHIVGISRTRDGDGCDGGRQRMHGAQIFHGEGIVWRAQQCGCGRAVPLGIQPIAQYRIADSAVFGRGGRFGKRIGKGGAVKLFCGVQKRGEHVPLRAEAQCVNAEGGQNGDAGTRKQLCRCTRIRKRQFNDGIRTDGQRSGGACIFVGDSRCAALHIIAGHDADDHTVRIPFFQFCNLIRMSFVRRIVFTDDSNVHKYLCFQTKMRKI